MKDYTFYQTLCNCFSPDKDCRKCQFFAQGLNENGKCRQLLQNELRIRKIQAMHKEEADNE